MTALVFMDTEDNPSLIPLSHIKKMQRKYFSQILYLISHLFRLCAWRQNETWRADVREFVSHLRFSWNLFFGVSGRHMASPVLILYNELAERFARESFYFLGELFIFDEGTLGWFSATSCMNVMQVSASAAYVFNMHPPTSVHFGDYPDVYLIKRLAQMQAMTRPGAAVDPRVHDLFQASKIVTRWATS